MALCILSRPRPPQLFATGRAPRGLLKRAAAQGAGPGGVGPAFRGRGLARYRRHEGGAARACRSHGGSRRVWKPGRWWRRCGSLVRTQAGRRRAGTERERCSVARVATAVEGPWVRDFTLRPYLSSLFLWTPPLQLIYFSRSLRFTRTPMNGSRHGESPAGPTIFRKGVNERNLKQGLRSWVLWLPAVRSGLLEFLKGMPSGQGGRRRKCLLKTGVLNGAAFLIFQCTAAAICDVAGSVPRRSEGHLLPGTAQIWVIVRNKGKPKIWQFWCTRIICSFRL